MLQPRSADLLRKIFENVGYRFPGDTFEKIWQKGVEIDGTGSVCVDTFHNLLKQHHRPKKLAVDELECQKLPL